MSRFRPRSSPLGGVLAPVQPVRPVRAASAPKTAPLPQSNRPVPVPSHPLKSTEPVPAMMQRIGFLVLCLYLVSGAVNEWAIRLMGIKGYLSVVTLVLLPVVWLTCGSAFRGLGYPIGWYWAGFLGWMLLDTPFSVWRGGSVAILMNYIPRSYMLFFFAAALIITLRNCRQLMYVNVAVGFMTLMTCIAFGVRGEDGRYRVPGGVGFFANSNELAMALLMGITEFVYLFSHKNRIAKAIAIVGIAVSVPYMLWTGSRGCLLGAIAYGILLLYMSRNRLRALLVIVVLAGIGVLAAPSAIVHRLMLLTGDEATNTSEMSAMESQWSRIDLLKRSVTETIQHPLFGVGPGQFAVAVAEEAKGEWSSWLGTHNSYTQVSSECGIPAFLFYVGTIVASFTMSFKLWKRFRDRPEGREIAMLGAALASGCVVYAVCSFFFHMAYSNGTLPLLAGQTLALYLAAKRKYPEPFKA